METPIFTTTAMVMLLVILAVQLAITGCSLYRHYLETDLMNRPPQKPLFERMVERADRDKLPADHELRTLAADLKRVVEKCEGPAVLVPIWAKARRRWCSYTGEPLI